MATFIIILVRKGDGIAAGANVDILDSSNNIVASHLTDSLGIANFTLTDQGSYTAQASFHDSEGDWTGSQGFITDPLKPVNVEVILRLN